MNRNVLTAFGLGLALVVTLAVGRLVGAQEHSKCASCAGWSMMEKKIKDAGGWIDYGKVKNGILAVALAPTPEKGEIVQAAFREFHQIAQFSSSNECTWCKEIEKISQQKGSTWEVTPLRTGAVYMLTSNKPKVVAKIHSLFDKGAEMMKQMEATKACSDTCSAGACTQKAAACSGCKQGACTHAKEKGDLVTSGEAEDD